MKLVRYQIGDAAPAVGVQIDDEVFASNHQDMITAIGPVALPLVAGERVTDFRLLAPIARPGKIYGSGINYHSHFQENPAAVRPTEPGFFSKFPSSVCGPLDAVRLGTPTSEVDYEVELAVVIGRPGRDIPAERAFEHIFGFTVINDVSDRTVQFRPEQKDLGKGFDTFCPMGPALVSVDEFPDLASTQLRSIINGELRQQATVGDMLFDIPTLLAHASQHTTLETGDLITTGTPAGCGTFRSPPLWLAPGDEMIVEVDGIGSLRNPVVAGWLE